MPRLQPIPRCPCNTWGPLICFAHKVRQSPSILQANLSAQHLASAELAAAWWCLPQAAVCRWAASSMAARSCFDLGLSCEQLHGSVTIKTSALWLSGTARPGAAAQEATVTASYYKALRCRHRARTGDCWRIAWRRGHFSRLQQPPRVFLSLRSARKSG